MRKLALLILLLPVAAFAVPAVTLSVSPATGVAPYSATLTWTVTGSASCAASDGWTGSKAASGTQSVSITAATKFTLTCVAADGKTKTTWTPPSTNTDGSPLTDLAGYNIYRGTTAANLARIKSVASTVTSYDDAGLASGAYLYSVTAVNAASAESARSTTASAVVTGSSASASASADVQTVPSPPTGLTVTQTTAYKMRQSVDGFSFVAFGKVPLGTACNEQLSASEMHVIPRASVTLSSKFDTMPLIAFAKCG